MKGPIKLIHNLLNNENIDTEMLSVGFSRNGSEPEEKPLDFFLHDLEGSILLNGNSYSEWNIMYIKYASWIIWHCNNDQPLSEVIRQYVQAEKCLAIERKLLKLEKYPTLKSKQENGSFLYQKRLNGSIDTPTLESAFWFQAGEPNFILCQRVYSPSLIDAASEVSDALCRYEPNLRRYFYRPEKFHITLCVFCLRSMEEANECFSFLSQYIPSKLHWIPSRELILYGLHNVQRRMLFVPCEHDTSLEVLVNSIVDEADRIGFAASYGGSFNPHVTLMKFPQHLQPELDIPSHWIYDFQDTYFGEVKFREFDFCLRAPGPDGFYHTLGTIQVQA